MCKAGTHSAGSLPRSRRFLNKFDDPFQTGGVSASILSNSCESRGKSQISHSSQCDAFAGVTVIREGFTQMKRRRRSSIEDFSDRTTHLFRDGLACSPA